jgi:hypothetical protein
MIPVNADRLRVANAVRTFGRRTARRFRMVRKARKVWGPTASLRPASMTAGVRYVLWHPELDTYSIALANPDAVLECISAATDVPVDRVRVFCDELLYDTAIANHLPRHMVRRNTRGETENLLGRHVPKYVIVRATKPGLIVETGVKDGYGSLALLTALARNRAEGAPGALLSFDKNPVSGHAVPRSLRAHWEFVPRLSAEMAQFLRAREVGLLVSDSSPDYACVATEVQTAVSAGAPQIFVLANAAWNSAVRDAEIASYTKSLYAFPLISKDPFFRPQLVDLAVFRRSAALA